MSDKRIIIHSVTKFRLTCPHCMEQIVDLHTGNKLFSIDIFSCKSIICQNCDSELPILQVPIKQSYGYSLKDDQ